MERWYLVVAVRQALKTAQHSPTKHSADHRGPTVDMKRHPPIRAYDKRDRKEEPDARSPLEDQAKTHDKPGKDTDRKRNLPAAPQDPSHAPQQLLFFRHC